MGGCYQPSDTVLSGFYILRLNFKTNGRAMHFNRSQCGSPEPPERIEDGIPNEREHANQTAGNLLREGRGMRPLNLPGNIRPYLLEPTAMVFFLDHR